LFLFFQKNKKQNKKGKEKVTTSPYFVIPLLHFIHLYYPSNLAMFTRIVSVFNHVLILNYD